jgi:ferrous iron transport protein B
VALAAAFVLRKLIVRGPQDPLVLELPPYRLPMFKGVLLQSWARTRQYIKKAGTFILAASILMWALMTFPRLPADQAAQITDPAALAEAGLSYSLAGRLGRAVKTVMDPIGVDWRGSVALVGGIAAKEVIVATMGAAYSLGSVDPGATGSLTARLAADPGWSPLSAFAFIVFVMLYAPCISTVAVIVQETRSWKWGAFASLYSTMLAWALAFVIFQGGRALGLGG